MKNNGCKNCTYCPANFEEYAYAKSNPGEGICQNAYSDVAKHCGEYKEEDNKTSC